MDLQKNLSVRHFYFLAMAVFLMACQKENEDIDKTTSILFLEKTIPTNELQAEGGSITLEVEWAYTKWNISADEVIEGNAFITEITPTYAGSAQQGATKSKVRITYKSNNTNARNRQKLTIRSLTENLSQSIVITQSAKPVVPVNITITPGTTYQTIAGFGGANKMWGTQFLSSSEIKSAFGTDDGDLGLSIFRVRIGQNPAEWSYIVESVKEAQKLNAKIIACPWSPPANLKNNKNEVDGELLEENYQAYALHLNSFVEYMASQGVKIYAVSIQNEPDITVSYESCRWSPQQMLKFIQNNAPSIKDTKIAAAESFNFTQSFTNVLLNDAQAVNNFDIVAGHIYGGGRAPYPLAEQKGKEIWMTEYLMNQNTNWNQSPSVIWKETMSMLTSVHECMENNWNAYIWWYLKRYYSFIGDGEQGSPNGVILKRGHAMAQFSKFVRPGFVRVKAQADISTGLKFTAYKDNNRLVVIIINPTENPVYEIKLVAPGEVSSATSCTTSELLDRKVEQITPTNSKVSINMPASSITTVVMNL